MSKRLPRGRSANSVALEPEIAIALIGLFSAAIDGEGIASTEEYALSEMLAAIGQFEDYTDEDFEELGEKVVALIEEEDPGDLIVQAINSLPNRGYREAAYITAVLVVAIDGELPESEEDYICDLQEALNISDERAQELINEIFQEAEEEEDEEYEEDEECEEDE